MRDTAFDVVFDAQQSFRLILDAMARPGRVVSLQSLPLSVPDELSVATATIALTLLDTNVTWHNVDLEPAAEEYLRVNTMSRSSEIEAADFVFLSGDAPQYAAELPSSGDLLYPETGATLIIQVASLTADPAEHAVPIVLRGPGIESTARFWVRPLRPSLLDSIAHRNSEFPLGLDTIFCADDNGSGPCIAGMPRSSQISSTGE